MNWISVEERLPEEGIPVLIWDSCVYEPFDVGIYYDGLGWYYAYHFYENTDDNIPAQPTHWQYITGPKED